MNQSRQLLLKSYGQLYTRLSNIELDKCWYCKSTRNCLDHCPPLACLNNLDIGKFREANGFYLIPSCSVCNSLLADKVLLTPYERLSWLLSTYKALFNRAHADWAISEIEEMGPYFQTLINEGKKQANQWLDKIAAIETAICNAQDFNAQDYCLDSLSNPKPIKDKSLTYKARRRLLNKQNKDLQNQQAKIKRDQRLREIRDYVMPHRLLLNL